MADIQMSFPIFALLARGGIAICRISGVEDES
jgi:hypothetical protein